MFSKVTITDVLIGADGEPLVGVAVNATLSTALQNGSEPLVPADTVTVYTNASGVFSFLLTANTDVGTTPAGSFYTITSPDAGLNERVVLEPTAAPQRLAQVSSSSGGGGTSLLRIHAVVSAAGVGTPGGSAELWVPPDLAEDEQPFIVGVYSPVPQVTAAKAGVHWHLEPSDFTGALVSDYIEFCVSSPDGTEQLSLESEGPFDFESGELFSPDMTDWTVVSKTGTDLVLSEDGKTIVSEAGGPLVAGLVVRFEPNLVVV